MAAETAYGILAVILVVFLAAATAKTASEKGGNAILWFLGGLVLPGLALVIALFLNEQLVKQCPACVRQVGRDARICSYCGHDFAARGNLRLSNFGQ
jgi:hypothetical protein